MRLLYVADVQNPITRETLTAHFS